MQISSKIQHDSEAKIHEIHSTARGLLCPVEMMEFRPGCSSSLLCSAGLLPATPRDGNLPQTLPWGTGGTAEKLQKQAAS